MNIFVGSLSFKTTEKQLQTEFEAFGEVESVKIILDQETLKSRGFAFVSMPNNEQATAAIAGLNGKQLDGFTLKVNEARPKEARGPNRERSGGYRGGSETSRPSYPTYGSPGGGRDSGGGRPMDPRDSDIYDSKGQGRGGSRKRGRGDGGGKGSGGRSGGGRKSY
ncbi:MAG: hypothetical protein AAGU11_24140 [Syntrophobacteraceae bacterium]